MNPKKKKAKIVWIAAIPGLTEKETIKVPSRGKEISQAEYDALVVKKTEEMRENFRNRGGRGRGR